MPNPRIVALLAVSLGYPWLVYLGGIYGISLEYLWRVSLDGILGRYLWVIFGVSLEGILGRYLWGILGVFLEGVLGWYPWTVYLGYPWFILVLYPWMYPCGLDPVYPNRILVPYLLESLPSRVITDISGNCPTLNPFALRTESM